MTTSPQIVEYAVLSYKDGREVKFARAHAGKAFYFVRPDGALGFPGYSRKRMKERPSLNRNCTGVTFEKASR